MKITELIKELSTIDQDLDVFCYHEEQVNDNKIQTTLYEIDTIEASAGVFNRMDDNKVAITFSKNARSKKVLLISITTDF